MKCAVLLFLVLTYCTGRKPRSHTLYSNEKRAKIKLSAGDSARLKNYWNKSWEYGLHSTEHQQYLDSALLIKPDSAYLWQQKAMPLYKARKYSVGKPFLAKAVEMAPEEYLDYSAFMKCIFSKEYEESITEFLDAKERFGDSYVMDHTYNFYIGLDYLQLNQYEKAREFLLRSKEQQIKDFPNEPPEEACHYLDWFYLGIAEYELKNYAAAIANFGMSLKVYKNFAEALYFKAQCLSRMGNLEDAKKIYKVAIENKGNTINEDNAIYEIYPYQVFHGLKNGN